MTWEIYKTLESDEIVHVDTVGTWEIAEAACARINQREGTRPYWWFKKSPTDSQTDESPE